VNPANPFGGETPLCPDGRFGDHEQFLGGSTLFLNVCIVLVRCDLDDFVVAMVEPYSKWLRSGWGDADMGTLNEAYVGNLKNGR